jgi:hypothetical protein
MTNLYRSTTRSLSFDALPAALAAKVREHAAAHQLALDGARVWLTHSENPKAEGFFASLLGRRSNPLDSDAEHWTCVVLHRAWILVATVGEKRSASALSLALTAASITRGQVLAGAFGAVGPSDPGFSITGFPGDHGRPGSYFVKVGDDDDGRACFAEVERAVLAAKNA